MAGACGSPASVALSMTMSATFSTMLLVARFTTTSISTEPLKVSASASGVKAMR